MKFKVGDKAMVKLGFDGWSVNPGMLDLEGKVVTITEVDNRDEVYLIREDDESNLWIDDFFERLATSKDIKEHDELKEQMKTESDAMAPWGEEEVMDSLAKKILERNNKGDSISYEEMAKELGLKKYARHKDPSDQSTNPINPAHYNKGEIDLFESAYRTRPFNEFRAIMEFVAERYMKRDKDNRIQDLDKAIYTLTRLKEYEEQNK